MNNCYPRSVKSLQNSSPNCYSYDTNPRTINKIIPPSPATVIPAIFVNMKPHSMPNINVPIKNTQVYSPYKVINNDIKVPGCSVYSGSSSFNPNAPYYFDPGFNDVTDISGN